MITFCVIPSPPCFYFDDALELSSSLCILVYAEILLGTLIKIIGRKTVFKDTHILGFSIQEHIPLNLIDVIMLFLGSLSLKTPLFFLLPLFPTMSSSIVFMKIYYYQILTWYFLVLPVCLSPSHDFLSLSPWYLCSSLELLEATTSAGAGVIGGMSHFCTMHSQLMSLLSITT